MTGVGETRRVEERRIPEANRFGDLNRPRPGTAERSLDAALRLDPIRELLRPFEMRPLDALHDRVTIELRQIELEIGKKFDFIGKSQLAFDLAHYTPGHLEAAVKYYILSENYLPQGFRLLDVRIQDVDVSAATFRPLSVEERVTEGIEGTRLIIPITNEVVNTNPKALVLTLEGKVKFDTTKLENLATILRATVELNQRLYADPTFPALNQLAFEIDMQAAHARMSESSENTYTLAVGVVNSKDGVGIKEHMRAISEAVKPFDARVYVLENGRVAVLAEGVTSGQVGAAFEKAQKSLEKMDIAQNVDSRFVIAEVQKPLDAETTVETPLQIVNRLSAEAYGMGSGGRGRIATETDLSYERGVQILSPAEADQAVRPASAEGTEVISKRPPVEVEMLDKPGYVEEGPRSGDFGSGEVMVVGEGDIIEEQVIAGPERGQAEPRLEEADRGAVTRQTSMKDRKAVEEKGNPAAQSLAHQQAPQAREGHTKFGRLSDQKEVEVIFDPAIEDQQRRQQQQRRQEEQQRNELEFLKLMGIEEKTWNNILYSSELYYTGAAYDLQAVFDKLGIRIPLDMLTQDQRFKSLMSNPILNILGMLDFKGSSEENPGKMRIQIGKETLDVHPAVNTYLLEVLKPCYIFKEAGKIFYTPRATQIDQAA